MPASNSSTIEFQTVKAGSNAFGQPKPAESLVRTKPEWEAVWKSMESTTVPRPPAPEIDFGKTSVIVVFAGEKPTGGYKLEVRSVTRTSDGKTLIVDVLEKAPGKGAIVTQAFTSPYQAIGVPAGDFAVEVKRSRE